MNENQVKANQEKMEWIEPAFEVLHNPEGGGSYNTWEGVYYGPSGS